MECDLHPGAIETSRNEKQSAYLDRPDTYGLEEVVTKTLRKTLGSTQRCRDRSEKKERVRDRVRGRERSDRKTKPLDTAQRHLVQPVGSGGPAVLLSLASFHLQGCCTLPCTATAGKS